MTNSEIIQAVLEKEKQQVKESRHLLIITLILIIGYTIMFFLPE